MPAYIYSEANESWVLKRVGFNWYVAVETPISNSDNYVFDSFFPDFSEM